jgi:hypothetical protein
MRLRLDFLLSKFHPCRFMSFDEQISVKNIPRLQAFLAGILAGSGQGLKTAVRLSSRSTNQVVLTRRFICHAYSEPFAHASNHNRSL